MVPGGAGNKSKHILRQFPIIRFYGALVISLVFFLIQLVVAHVAHSLILQIDAYHMLYNILSLTTCIVTAKASKGNSVKNTFGWRRIDVCGAVANLCFLAALGFSVVVESLQTLFHASHHEKMHYPLPVGVVGVLGLFVNAFTFILIGGYTHHQSGYLCSTKDGRGEDSVISDAMRRGPYSSVMRERQGLFETFRDTFGCILVIITAVVVYYWTDDPNADSVDPYLTIGTVVVLGFTSYKYGKEAGYILLLTIPDHINVASLQAELKKHFPEVFDIHEFHVWQLTPARIIASVHVVLQKPAGYLSIQNNIIHFLHEKGISHVTMQPEFLQMTEGEVESPQSIRRRKCFLPCCSAEEECHEMQCCNDEEDDHDHDDEHDDDDHDHSHGHSHCHATSSVGKDSFSQCGSSINNSSLNVQSLSSGRRAQVGVPKSESLNNHIDLVDISLDDAKSHRGTDGGESDDLSDDEQVNAELRPMI
ncbi:Zinc transporter 10 [Orchesella cincta]|uniref:Zinc transporter 10 n=1 Tax=Orchesella cincta TaxID=48709 RepID=A0A1D2N5R7_ORCCI|nr:Zinc transporter 10 [Orchesella cincta]